MLDKDHEIRLAVSCLLARGHLLIEDLPGVGKTLLARSLASGYWACSSGVSSSPATCCRPTSSAYRSSTRDSRFHFHPGPLFSQLVLADEVNRATPKAQSALLEAMEERQVTADGETYDLPEPFFVIATQNPVQQVGTFPLPESQLDRFLMRIGLATRLPEMETETAAPAPIAATLLAELEPALWKRYAIAGSAERRARGARVADAAARLRTGARLPTRARARTSTSDCRRAVPSTCFRGGTLLGAAAWPSRAFARGSQSRIRGRRRPSPASA